MNANAKHSPAPWRIDGETIRADNGWEICNPFQTDAPTGLIECGANARLIAAAPALLEALKICQVRIFMVDGCSQAYEQARAAIAQAEGGAQ